MKPTTRIDVQLVDLSGNSLSIADVSVGIVLYCHGNYRYHFSTGVTDHHGRIAISYAALESERRKNGLLFLMDYNTRLDDCDDEVRFVVPTLDELKARLEHVKKYYREYVQETLKLVAQSNNGLVEYHDVGKIALDEAMTLVELPCKPRTDAFES